MSRVYNVMTGAGRPAGSGTSAAAVAVAADASEAPDDGAWENSDDTPFIEIGGPGGPVFSAPPAASAAPPTARVAPPPAPEPKPDAAARPFPRLAPSPGAPTYISVRFHDVAARAAHVAGDGPDPSLVALHLPDHPVSGEYRLLRDEIRRQLPESGPKVFLFAAAAPEAGTTTVLLNLAVTLARGGRDRVLVVDANVARSAVAARLAVKPTPGLAEVLANAAPLGWALQPSTLPNLQVLAAGEFTDGTPAAVGRDFPRLLNQLRQWFDWVLVDAGVWGGMPERDAACPSADAVYLVTREAEAERPPFTSVRGWVKELGGVLRGYVATRV
jgi:Mrp family chromosome partitioning ATPase